MNHAPEIDPRPCPTPAELAAFLCDELQPAAMDDIGAHVSNCQVCDAVVRRMDEATDGSYKALRTHLRNDPTPTPPDDPECHRMMAAARALSPTLVLNKTPPPEISPPFHLGRYRIGERLGQGGMGAVYRAEHVRLKKPVAVKILSPIQTRDHRAVARFELEMEVVGRLDHPNIVRATDAGEADGVHFLVMELIDGVNLAHLLLRRGPLPVPEACELVRQAAVGLQHAHEHGLVHRDVKPSNLMLSATGRVQVLDLGLALLRAGGPPVGELTGIGEIMGTVEYMAPEQWAETHTVDIRADIYSLGCTLYALLTGDPPFTRSGRHSYLRMMSAHQQDPVRPVTDHRTDIPPALCNLLDRMLAKNPDARPDTPGEVAAELERLAIGADLAAFFATGTPGAKTIANHLRPALHAPIPATAATVRSRRRGRRILVATLAVVAVAAIAVGVGAYVAVTRPTNSGTPIPNEEPTDLIKWRNLLTERPRERLWVPNRDAELVYKPDKETLLVQSPRWALISLGDTKDPGYKLQVGFRQMRWPGGIGVYFAGRPNPATNEFVFHLVRLVHTKAGKGREYGLERARGSFSLEPGVRAPGVSGGGFASDFLPPPENEEQLLELDVKSNVLASVRWNGTACPKLVNEAAALAAARNAFPDATLTGEYGIYCYGATVTVSTARYVATE